MGLEEFFWETSRTHQPKANDPQISNAVWQWPRETINETGPIEERLRKKKRVSSKRKQKEEEKKEKKEKEKEHIHEKSTLYRLCYSIVACHTSENDMDGDLRVEIQTFNISKTSKTQSMIYQTSFNENQGRTV